MVPQSLYEIILSPKESVKITFNLLLRVQFHFPKAIMICLTM